jgi:hypothetical protein
VTSLGGCPSGWVPEANLTAAHYGADAARDRSGS